MAAPVASSLLADILPYIGIEPNYTSEELAVKDIMVPDVVGKSLSDAKSSLGDKFEVRTVGDGGFVTAQTPNAASEIAPGSTVILYLGAPKSTQTVDVPNLVGMSASRARAELTHPGLYLQTTGNINTGSGTVIACRQSIPKNTQVEVGTVIEVQFSDTNVGDR